MIIHFLNTFSPYLRVNSRYKLFEKNLDGFRARSSAAADIILQEIDDRRAFRELGYRSVFEYATQALKLSESVAYNLITVARKAREVPVLKDKIREQSMTLSNARMIAPVLTPENQEKWIAAAQTLSKRELEKEDPLEKAERAETRRAAKPAPGQAKSDLSPRTLPAAMKHAVHLRDGTALTRISTESAVPKRDGSTSTTSFRSPTEERTRPKISKRFAARITRSSMKY